MQKVDDRNYVIKTVGRRKETQLCHINMLKKYFDKEQAEMTTVPIGINCPVESLENMAKSDNIKTNVAEDFKIKLQNSNVLNDLDSKVNHLLPDQQKDLIHLIEQFPDLFRDIPLQTHTTTHDVDVGDASPIKQHPYRPIKADIMNKEIQIMLENKIIEPSMSNWSSPCLLVPQKRRKLLFLHGLPQGQSDYKIRFVSNTTDIRLY